MVETCDKCKNPIYKKLYGWQCPVKVVCVYYNKKKEKS